MLHFIFRGDSVISHSLMEHEDTQAGRTLHPSVTDAARRPLLSTWHKCKMKSLYVCLTNNYAQSHILLVVDLMDIMKKRIQQHKIIRTPLKIHYKRIFEVFDQISLVQSKEKLLFFF